MTVVERVTRGKIRSAMVVECIFHWVLIHLMRFGLAVLDDTNPGRLLGDFRHANIDPSKNRTMLAVNSADLCIASFVTFDAVHNTVQFNLRIK